MSKNSSRDRHSIHKRLIEYLEDQNFRNWVLKPDTVSIQDAQYWEKEVKGNVQARKAKVIIIALQNHFDQNQMTQEEIENHLQLEIGKYRFDSGKGESKYLKFRFLSRIAAAIALLIGLVFLVKWMNRPFEVYTTGYGEQLTINLPDETIIRLNSNSSLTWDRKWEKSGDRVVDLVGEAFFEVEHHDGIPFQVNTDDITIHVTGTQFNVNSRRNRSMVYLDEGKVNVEIKSRPDERFEMEPGDELVYQAALDKLEQKRIEAPEEISSWKEGMLVFRDEPLMKVLESISDIYGKEFVLKDTALIGRNITTTIPLTNWDVSLTAIQLAMRLKVEEERDTVWIQGIR